jgi:hypothetical protein
MLQVVVVDKEKFSLLRKSAHKLAEKLQEKERMQIPLFPKFSSGEHFKDSDHHHHHPPFKDDLEC